MQTLVGKCTRSSKICTHFELVSKLQITHNNDDSLLSHIKNGDNDSLLFYVSLCFVVFCLRDGIARNNVALRFTTLTPPCGDESRPQPSNVSCERHERSLRVLRPGKSRDFDTKLQSFLTKSAFVGINPLRG